MSISDLFAEDEAVEKRIQRHLNWIAAAGGDFSKFLLDLSCPWCLALLLPNDDPGEAWALPSPEQAQRRSFFGIVG